MRFQACPECKTTASLTYQEGLAKKQTHVGLFPVTVHIKCNKCKYVSEDFMKPYSCNKRHGFQNRKYNIPVKGGPPRLGWWKKNIEIVLATMLMVMAGDDLEILTAMLDLPGAMGNKPRFQNIEKNILLPNILTLTKEVVRESLDEDIRLAFLADGKSNEFIEKGLTKTQLGN